VRRGKSGCPYFKVNKQKKGIRMGTIRRETGLVAGVKKWETMHKRSMDLVNIENWGKKR